MPRSTRTAFPLALVVTLAGCGEPLPDGAWPVKPTSGPVDRQDPNQVAVEYLRRVLTGDDRAADLLLPAESCPPDLRRYAYLASVAPTAADPLPVFIEPHSAGGKGAGRSKTMGRLLYRYTGSIERNGYTDLGGGGVCQICDFDLEFEDGTRERVLVALRPEGAQPVEAEGDSYDAGLDPTWGVVSPPE